MGDAANNANAKSVPIRLCYHRGCHYNSLVDPHTATIGVGLGLPNHNPGSADRNLIGQAVKQSEQDAVEKTMLEDKIRATGKVPKNRSNDNASAWGQGFYDAFLTIRFFLFLFNSYRLGGDK